MQPSPQPIILKPWIVAENKSQIPTKYLILPTQPTEEPSTLISVLALKQQMMPMISNLQFSTQGVEEGETIVYLSNQIRVGSQLYQIAYLPGQTKLQSDCAVSLANILRDLSQVVISDVNCSTLHKIRDRPILPGCKQYVVINGRDIYSVGGGQNKIELLKKLEGSLGTGLIHPEFLSVGGKTANIGKLQEVMNSYLCDWQLMLQGERSWAAFTASVLQHFKIEEWLWQDSIKLRQMKYNGLMLSIKQIEMLEAEICKICNYSSPWEQKIGKSVISKIMKQIKQENQQNLQQHLLQLKQNFTATSIYSLPELQQKQQAVEHTLQHYGIPLSLSACITAQKQRHLLQNIINQSQRQLQEAKDRFALIQAEKEELKAKLRDCMVFIEESNRKTAEMKCINKQFEEIQHLLNSEKHENRKLKLELQSHIYMEKRNNEFKNQLQFKIQEGNAEREGLITALQQLTQQNLTLMSQKQELQIEINQLKERVEEQEHIEARALRSIENEAEIRVRLTRYENYVKQLKVSLSSFKKVQAQKFNYILERNYKQYKSLKQLYQASQTDLQHANEQLKQLKDNLQSQKLRMSYFQKIVLSSLQNESIPEVSEQNSSDRNQTSA